MIQHRPKSQLGQSDFGWLRARHHIAIDGRNDNPAHAPVGALFVWNDDTIAAGAGVPMHPHAHVEIITYVREGRITHRDTLGTEGTLEAGDVQVMSAGTGLRHAETSDVPTRIFQIWIAPRERGGEPRWETRSFPARGSAHAPVVLASGFPEDTGALPIRAEARLLRATLQAGESFTYALGAHRNAYLVPSRGKVRINGVMLDALDGAAASNEDSLDIQAIDDTELLFVDVD